MNHSGLIRQYVLLVVVALLAIFVATQLELKVPSFEGDKLVISVPDDAVVAVDGPEANDLSFRDLRSGGIGKKLRRQLPAPFATGKSKASVTTVAITAASSTPFSAATSSPFQRAATESGTYPGVKVEFSGEHTGTTAKADRRPVSETGTTRIASQAVASPGSEENSDDIISDTTISGHVVDDGGEPIAGLGLTLKLSQASAEDKARFGMRTLNTLSDEQGAYSFENLVVGDYQLCTLQAKGFKPACQRPRAPYSSADFSLRNVIDGRVYGIVSNEQGELLSEVSVSATPGQRDRATTNSKGEYELKMTVSADSAYQVYFSRNGYTRERVALKGREILSGRELAVTLKKTEYNGFDVQGTIYDQSGSPVSGRTVTLYSPSVKSTIALRAISDSKGKFTIKYVVAADDYRLSVNTGGSYTFDAAPYASMEVYDGMALLNLQLQGAGKGSFSARVISSNGSAIKGEIFTLFSGSAYVGRSSSDSGGVISFDEVPVKPGGSSLRVSGGSTPKYTFSGVSLQESEHISSVELVVDRGESSLVVTVLDEAQTPLQGAQGVLIWTKTENGVRSQTMRSRGKMSMAGTGSINFSELGPGVHQLQVRKQGYLAYSGAIDISQVTQNEVVVLKSRKNN